MDTPHIDKLIEKRKLTISTDKTVIAEIETTRIRLLEELKQLKEGIARFREDMANVG